MARENKFLLCSFIIVLFSFQYSSAKDAPTDIASCQQSLSQSGNCPSEMCYWACINPKESIETCTKSCFPKPCFEIPVEDCPLSRCAIMEGCGKKSKDDQSTSNKVCYEKVDEHHLKCGGLAYAGQNIECCKGLVKRCGIEFFNGTCDMIAAYSANAVPFCLPCGNGICNQFENRCNCPEDCR